MKQQVSTALKAFLLNPPTNYTMAECLTITLISGQVFQFTTWDKAIRIANWAGGSSTATFTSRGSRLTRGSIKNQRGIQTSSFDINIDPVQDGDPTDGTLSSPPTQVGNLSLTQAIIGNLMYGANFRLEAVYQMVRSPDGSYNDNGWGSLIKFIGQVGNATMNRGTAKITVVSQVHLLEPMWPPYIIQPQCRWRLFDANCTLNPATFAINSSALAGSTPTVVQTTLANPSGYFNNGKITFTSGLNNGLSVLIKSSLGAGAAANYVQTVLNDKPYVYYRFNDSSGSTAHDSSGNGYNATKTGTVTFGQTSLMAGDTGTAALFDGSTGYFTCPAPIPSNWAAGITFEAWFSLTSGAAANQPTGLFDTSPGNAHALRNNGELNDSTPGFEWVKDKPFVAMPAPTPGTVVHVVVVFRGRQTIDVYVNGQLFDSEAQPGNGGIAWANPKIGRSGGILTYLNATMQHFAIYNFPMGPSQPLTHYTAGTTAGSTGGNGVLNLLHPLPYAPAAGDTFTALPGCAKTISACISLGNLPHFSGAPFTPVPESGF